MYWVGQADWQTPLLDVDDVADLLGVQPNTVAQLVARGALAPAEERVGRKNAWAPGDVYPYALARTPEAGACIPRLFPRIPNPAPAKFVGAESISLMGEGPRFVVYEWSPGDGAAGPIRLAYPIGDARGRRNRHVQAEDLYAWFGEGAVAVPSGFGLPDYPGLCVADATTKGRPTEYPWSYLAGLLRIDVPWWPTVLRREEAMLAWRPGLAPSTVAPYIDGYDAEALTDMIDSATTELAAQALRQRAAKVRRRQISSEFRPGGRLEYADTLGFVCAARHDIDMDADHPGVWTWDQAAAVLHHPAPSPAAADAALRAMISTEPVAVATVTVSASDTHPWALEWVHRLEPATGIIELGDHLAAREAGRHPILRYLRDPLNPECWVAETVLAVHATVGTRVPGVGPVQSVVLLGVDRAFFRDGGGTIWPLPHPDEGAFHSGFGGHGPGDFARAITRLAEDSSASADTGPQYDEDGKLWALISTQSPPLVIDVPHVLGRAQS